MNTGKMTVIARPYAIAAFEYALKNGHEDLLAWESLLEIAALIAEDTAMQRLFSNPQITSNQLGDLFISILHDRLDEGKENFIRLLAENQRLSVVPEIASLFKLYRQSREKIVTVDVTSAVPLSESYQQHLITVLTKRLQQTISLSCTVDPSLMGGAVIRAGDRVIDGSIRNKLNRLKEFIIGIS